MRRASACAGGRASAPHHPGSVTTFFRSPWGNSVSSGMGLVAACPIASAAVEAQQKLPPVHFTGS